MQAQSNLSAPVNIGSGKPVTVREIAITIGAILKRPELIALGALPYGVSDPMFICANNRRLIEHTSWVPRFDLEQGLHHIIEWWQSRLEVD